MLDQLFPGTEEHFCKTNYKEGVCQDFKLDCLSSDGIYHLRFDVKVKVCVGRSWFIWFWDVHEKDTFLFGINPKDTSDVGIHFIVAVMNFCGNIC